MNTTQHISTWKGIASSRYQGCVHVAFKLDGLLACSNKELFDNVITPYVLVHSSDKSVANFIGLD